MWMEGEDGAYATTGPAGSLTVTEGKRARGRRWREEETDAICWHMVAQCVKVMVTAKDAGMRGYNQDGLKTS